ncbi:MAG TPA: TAXI family TRAP transporter solute-binding subunit [Beijerinckiaceae bacterium]|jgi:TRAP transporter TAXI family solute receptor
MRRLVLTLLAAALALFALSLLGVQYLTAPTTLRVAVGPMSSEDTRLMAAVAQYLARERAAVRVKLVLTEGVAGSAESLDNGKADLAVVRTDAAVPPKAQTLVIMHRDAAVLMTTGATKIERVAGLSGKTVGIVRRIDANAKLLATVLNHYEIEPGTVRTILFDSAAAVADALRAGEIDAVLAVGTPSGKTVTDAVAAVTQAAGGPPVFVPINEADAIAQRLPAFESFEIVRGTFGGSPPRPMESVTTLGVNHRLVATPELDDDIASELTRLIFAMRPAIATEVPLANRIEAPDTSKSSSLPVHPGAAAYYEGEVQTFFERYGDWMYLGIMVISIAGSAAAAMAGKTANHNRARKVSLLNRLLDIVRAARRADTLAELDALESEADDILGRALSKAGQDGIDEASMVAFTLGLDQARHAIGERRRWLETHPTPLSQAAE